MSYGCINAKPELMAKIAENNRMDESHVFVVPDNQEMVDEYIANTVPNEDLTRETVEPLTRTTQVPEKPSAPKVAAREEKAVEQKTQAEINRDRQLKKLAQREKPLDKPYYNDFTSNIDYQELFKRAKVSREDRIKEYAQTRAASRRALKKIAKYGSDIPMQRELNELLNKEEMLKAAVSINKPKRNTAADFMARATQEMANENLAPEVEAVIRQIYEKYPNILEGLRLSIRAQKAEGNEAGNFNPYTRFVTLWKDSSGVENVSTIRHELTHSLEQMMTPEARQAVVEAWARSFETAIKRNTDKKSQEFFNKVFDFLDSPSKESFDAATKVMPSYDFYQYMNPSEYWAVNAEKLMEAKLGTPWARFVSAVKKLLEGLKSVFGVNNTFTVHKEFDNIINGKLERTKNKEMLVDYLFQGKVKLDFLNSIEDVNDLLDKHNRPDAPRKPSLSVRDAFMGGYENTKETVKDVLTSPLVATNNMIGQADRALTYFRNKNIFFGYGLEEADRQRYGGQVRNAHQQAIASLAVVNALHSGNVATRVMTEGKLIFDNNIQMFVAEKSDKSMANVVREKAKLIDKLGFDTGNRVIQSYFEAKRSRSIVNEYLNREAAYEAAIESGQKEEEARKDLANIEKALEKVQMDDEAMDDFIALENQYPELRKMMDNWTAVNQNMIDMMEFSGIISKQRAKSLRSIKDYVPWYRIMDDQEDIHSAPKNTRGLTNVAADKKFGPGGTDRDIDDIVDNMIHNVLTITRNTARNYAANRIVMEYGERYKDGKKAGKLRVFPKERSDADGVRFNIIANGRRIVVRIQDPLVAEAVIGMENIDIPMNGALAFMANTLRRSITTFPAFQVAQLFMDAPTAALVTGLKRPDKVWAGVFTSFLMNLRKDDPIVTKFRNAGIGGYQSSARTPEKEIQLDIGLVQGSWFSKAMKGLDRFGDASDYAQRRSVYLQTMKETGDEMLAYFQANNVIDFKKRGSGQIAQLLTRQVAFMNAYAQAIDVLAKGLAGTGLKGIDRKKAFGRMVVAGMMLASATIVYCMLIGDDDEYNKLDDQTKMRNIFIPGLDMRLPMHSGAAFFFKAIPELIYNAIMKEGTKDEYDRKRLTRALGKAAVDSLLGPNPTPTGVKPFIEIALNRNFFTGGQVTPRGMEDLAAYRQYNQNTSELGKIISALTGTEKNRLLNPIEADHLVRGLTGTIGAAVMWGSNLLSGDRPTPQAKDNPLYGQFVMPDVPRGREDLYYDLKSKTDEAYKTYMDLQKKQRKEEAAEWFKENKKLIQVYGYTSVIEADLKRLNGEIRRLSDLPSEKMSPDAKRKRMTELQELKGRILKDVISMRKRAGLDESYL
jgi:hemoglobin-like flavoprotein